MKILIVHNRYLRRGGEDEVVQSEKNMLEHFGHEVTLYERRNAEIGEWNIVTKISFILKDIVWSRRSYNEIKEIIRTKRPDVVHVHNTFLVISPSVYAVCRGEGVPVVQTLHNYRLLCPIGTFYRKGKVCEDCLKFGKKAAVLHRCWKKSFVLSFLLVRALKAFDMRSAFFKTVERFIVLSDFSKKKYTSNGFLKERISVKSNFIEFDPGASTQIGTYALYVGALQDYKGIETLTKAWCALKNPIPLKIIGGGPLKEKILRISEGANIEYLGEQSLDSTIKTIKDSRFVVLPSECYENFPRVVVEAFACGVPVVGSKIGALEELIEHGRTGLLFEPGSVGKLLDVLRMLLEDTELLMRMKQHARREYEMKYDIRENYGKLMEIYNKAISSAAERYHAKKPDMLAGLVRGA